MPLLLALAALLASTARAHQPGLSVARIGDGQLVVAFSATEVQQIQVDPAKLAAGVAIAADGAPCSLGEPAVTEEENDGLALTMPLSCPPGASWTYRADNLAGLTAGHRQFVEAFGAPVAVLDATRPEAAFAGAAAPEQTSAAGEVGVEFVKLGVEHIWKGYDHLAFLLALVLAATSLRQMLLVVTGFTLAHSVTLSLAATGVVTPPSALVELAIAATIVYTGVENLWRPGARRRFFLTFALGLIHGFGFAGVLADRGLPEAHTALALVSFNVGVELGQAAVVTVVLPLLLYARRFPGWERRAVPAASLAIAAAGVYWVVERAAGM